MKGMQFKITIQDIKPPIWRRIIVPENYSFWDFHVAIQDSLGWLDSHLHAFELDNYKYQIGLPSQEGDELHKIKPGWEVKIINHINKVGQRIRYEYDFGDGWEHEIVFEKEVDQEIKKPKCLAGARACPPEDCGGTGGYENFCNIMKSKKGNEYKEMKEWYGKDYDPEQFDSTKVKFDDPIIRFETMQVF